MQLKVYEPQEFIKVHGELLLHHEIEAQLIFNNAHNYILNGKNEHYLQGSIIDKGQVVALFQNAYPFNLQILSLHPDEKVITKLADYLVTHNVMIKGINANQEVCALFMQVYPGDFKLHLAMDIMVLKTLIPAKDTGRLILATMQDYDKVCEASMNFEMDCFGKIEDKKRTLENAKIRINQNRQYLFANHEGEIVGIINTSRETLGHSTSISGVYIYPAYRNNGHGASMVQQLVQIIQKAKPLATLFVDKKNPISNRVYAKIGFVIKYDVYDYYL